MELLEIEAALTSKSEILQEDKEIWRDITSGKLPILFDSEHNFQQGIFPVSMYSNYATDETGDYDLSVLVYHRIFLSKGKWKFAKGCTKNMM